MRADGGDRRLVPTGAERAHTPVFTPDGLAVLYAARGPESPAMAPAGAGGGPGSDKGAPAAEAETGLWLFDPALDLFRCNLDGSNLVRLTTAAGYDAEASYSWGGAKIVFTSFREESGDIWMMNADGSAPQRLIRLPGYAGGAEVSPDGSQVVFHAMGHDGGQAVEIYIADLPGGNPRQVTNLKATSFAPCWHPSQQFIVFASNADDHDYELFMVRPDGTGLERVTFSPGFDGYPAFSRSGNELLWTSLRGSSRGGQTNIFAANWAR
jgi:Tol biopolymer transport system component